MNWPFTVIISIPLKRKRKFRRQLRGRQNSLTTSKRRYQICRGSGSCSYLRISKLTNRNWWRCKIRLWTRGGRSGLGMVYKKITNITLNYMENSSHSLKVKAWNRTMYDPSLTQVLVDLQMDGFPEWKSYAVHHTKTSSDSTL